MYRRWKTQAGGRRGIWLLILVLALTLSVQQVLSAARAQAPPVDVGAQGPSISGRLLDPLGEPIHDAEIAAVRGGTGHSPEGEPLAIATSHLDGSFLLDMPPSDFETVRIEIERPHFQPLVVRLDEQETAQLNAGEGVRLQDIELARRITAGFWVATASFVLVLLLIALERLHKTTAALLGAALVLGVSFVGGALNPNLHIFDFEQALAYVDFDVIFLVMGMMIVIGVIEETGIFQ